ncbi:MFS transporter [Niabella aurantiaca]|uniref:MFS transporter n=1 Tax=Niabella aurantiaca TaxID=379900 RepID=UPI0003644E61|nr:MFS transporter [Niabella aurantiaca]
MEIRSISGKPALPSGAWLIVVLLSVGGCLNYLDRIVITTMRASIIEAIPMTEAQFGLLTSSFLWTYGILSPFAGYLADKFNRSRVICLSVFVWSAVTWMTAYTTTFSELLATRILMGVSEACFIPAALALIADYHRNRTRSLATGILMVGIMTGSGFGFAGGWVAEKYYWNTIFVYLGVFGIAYTIFLFFTLKDLRSDTGEAGEAAAPKEKVNFREAITSLFRLRSYIFILIAWGLLGVVAWLVVGWLPTYFLEKFRLSEGMAGLYATAYFYAVALAGLLLGGYWSDRWSRTNPKGRLLVPIIGIMMGAPCIFMSSYLNVLPLVVICFMVYALSKSFIDTNMMPILCLVVNRQYRATAYGILNFLACIIGGIGIYAGGALRDMQVNMDLIFRFAAVTMVIALVLLLMVKIKAEGPLE